MILPGIEIVILSAGMMVLGASIAARMTIRCQFTEAGESVARVHKSDLRQTVERHKAVRKRVMAPAFVAHYVLEQLRYEDSKDYPVLAGDLDDFIDQWCDENNVERVAKSTVREIIAGSPRVTKARPRLNMDNPSHRFIRQRQLARGEPLNDRPVIYVVEEIPVTPVATNTATRPRVRTETNPCPTDDRRGRTRVRPEDGHVADHRPKERKREEIGRQIAA